MKLKQGKFRRKIFYVASFFVLLIVIALFRTYVFNSTSQSTTSSTQTSKPINSQVLNKSFDFPIRNDKSDEVGKIKYRIESAETRDQIYVKGQPAKVLEGRKFLIINLKLENNFKQGIRINTRDYVRLSRNNNDKEWLAPTIHNDPVEVQAISTELTRVGFVINQNDKNLILRIGEINGEKQNFNLSL